MKTKSALSPDLNSGRDFRTVRNVDPVTVYAKARNIIASLLDAEECTPWLTMEQWQQRFGEGWFVCSMIIRNLNEEYVFEQNMSVLPNTFRFQQRNGSLRYAENPRFYHDVTETLF